MFTRKVVPIAVSAQQVAEADARCARQRAFIKELKAAGQPTNTAEMILASMEGCLARLREAEACQIGRTIS